MKTNVSKIARGALKTLKKNSPTILFVLGITGSISATVMAVKATPDAVEKIKADSREAHDGDPNAYTKKEAVKSAWKFYIPAAATGAISIVCLASAHSINLKRNAALTTACTISQAALNDYTRKAKEIVGEKKDQEIRQAVMEEHSAKRPINKSEVIITEKGKSLCYDDISGRYFMSDIDTLKRAENELNRQMRYDMRISLNEFYDAIGLPNISIGDDLGWDIEQDYIRLIFGSKLAEDGTPCVLVGYSNPPTYVF